METSTSGEAMLVKVRVRATAFLLECGGEREVVGEELTVARVIERLGATSPGIRRMMDRGSICGGYCVFVNGRLVRDAETRLADGDQVLLSVEVSGG